MKTNKSYLVSNHRLVHMADELHRQTGNKDAVARALKSADLTEQDLVEADRAHEPQKVDGQKEARFLQAAVAIVQDTSFAAKAGARFDHNTSIGAYVGKYSKDISQALENAQKYILLVDGNFSYQLQVSSNSASVALHSAAPILELGDRIREFLIFGLLAALQTIADRKFFPLEIRFEHAAPSAQKSIRRLAGCPVVFDAEDTEIILAPSTLKLPIPTYDPKLLSYLEAYANSLLEKTGRAQPDLQTRIEALLIDNLPGHLITATEAAASLGMSNRTFIRRLADVGVSFSSIVEQLRCVLAKTYLTQSETPIAEVAFLLGYSDQAAFSTAFKRWTGATPRAFRTEQFDA